MSKNIRIKFAWAIGTLLGIVAIVFITGQLKLNSEHSKEIKRVIVSRGGEVKKIKKVTLEESPFNESNKSNVIYKVNYVDKGVSKTAWYRGVKVPSNIHAHNPTATINNNFNEKWIFK